MTLALGASTSAHAAANVTTITTSAITTSATGSGFIIVCQGAGSSFITPTDSKGNTYVQIGATQNYNFGSNRHAAIWYCANGTGGSGHTATGGYASGFVDQSIYLKEITSSVGNGITLDQSALTTSSTLKTTAITTTVAAEAILAVFCGASTNATATHTVSGGSFAIDSNCNVTNGASNQDCTGCIAAEIVSSIQSSLQATFTEVGNSGGTMAMIAASFSEAAGSGATGTAAITEGHDVAAGVSPGVIGTAGITEGHDTPSGLGGASTSGTAYIIQPPEVINATGGNTATGTAPVIEYADTVTALGAIGGVGFGSPTEGSDVVTATGSAGTVGSAASTEGPDVSAAIGLTATSGSAAAAEAQDVVTAAGVSSTTGIAALLEASDVAAATGAISRRGAAVVLETQDFVNAVGIALTVGSATLAEAHDIAAAAGIGSTTGSAAVVEPHDVIVAAGQSVITITGINTESRDGVIGLTLTTASGAMAERTDYSTSLILILNQPGVAAILEGNDTIDPDGTGVGTLSRFGSATVVAVSQTEYQAAQSAYLEGSVSFVEIAYFNSFNARFVPQAVWYRIDDIDTNINIVPWTVISPTSYTNEVMVTSVQNAIISLTRSFERHQVLFQIIDGYGDTNFASTIYELVRATGMAPVAVGSGNTTEGADAVAGHS